MKTFITYCISFLCVFANIAQEAPQQKETSKFSLSGGVGFGFRTAKLAPSLSEQERKDEKSMLSGISFFVMPRYQLNDTYSVGLNYRQFSASKKSEYSVNNFNLYVSQKRNIYYVGPTLHQHIKLDQAELSGFVSLGYISYTADIEISGATSRTTKYTGANFGMEFGLEYLWRIAPKFYGGASLGYTLGTLTKIKIKNDSQTTTLELKDDEREGLQFLSFNPMLRLYL